MAYTLLHSLGEGSRLLNFEGITELLLRGGMNEVHHSIAGILGNTHTHIQRVSVCGGGRVWRGGGGVSVCYRGNDVARQRHGVDGLDVLKG